MPDIKVLMVDDEEEFASTVSERLQLRGYDIKAVFRAEDGLKEVKPGYPDVALLDLKMPGMDGLTLLRNIKKIDPSIEVIMLTGHGALKESSEGLESGAFDYIMKPIDIDNLIDKIGKAAQKKKQAERA
jgi:DNA-binding NtrC family response regulator